MEEKTKYEAFIDEVNGLKIDHLKKLISSVGDMPHDLYNQEKKFLKVLIEFVILLEEGAAVSLGSLLENNMSELSGASSTSSQQRENKDSGHFLGEGTESSDESETTFHLFWDESYIAALKELLNKCEIKDLQIAYIFAMIRSSGLISAAEFETLVTNSAMLMSVGGDLKPTISARIITVLIKRYLETNDPQIRFQCIKLWICCQYYGRQDFNPLSLRTILAAVQETFPGFDRFTYQALATKDSAYTDYLKSLTQFNAKNFLVQLPQELNDSIHAFFSAANAFYLNPRTNENDRDSCLELVNEIYEVSKKLDQISKNTRSNQSALADELNNLFEKTTQIGVLIDRLENTAPRDSLNWLKISLVSLFSALILTIAWVIPSLTCYGRNSFFRHVPPVIPRAQELVQRLEDQIQSQLSDENSLESERAVLISD